MLALRITHVIAPPRPAVIRPQTLQASRRSAQRTLTRASSDQSSSDGSQRRDKDEGAEQAIWKELKEISAVQNAALFQTASGDTAGAKRTLANGISAMYRKYGDGTEALGVLHADLAELHFQDQEYEEACAQAKAAFYKYATAFGPNSNKAVQRGTFWGITLLGCGELEEAAPLLKAGGAALENVSFDIQGRIARNMAHAVLPAQEDMAELVEALAAAGKAKFYDGLCRTYMASPDKVAQDNIMQDLMVTGISEMAMRKGKDVELALREHQRMVDRKQLSAGSSARARLVLQHRRLVEASQEHFDEEGGLTLSFQLDD